MVTPPVFVGAGLNAACTLTNSRLPRSLLTQADRDRRDDAGRQYPDNGGCWRHRRVFIDSPTQFVYCRFVKASKSKVRAAISAFSDADDHTPHILAGRSESAAERCDAFQRDIRLGRSRHEADDIDDGPDSRRGVGEDAAAHVHRLRVRLRFLDDPGRRRRRGARHDDRRRTRNLRGERHRQRGDQLQEAQADHRGRRRSVDVLDGSGASSVSPPSGRRRS